MVKKAKIIFLVIMFTIMVFTLVGCGNNNENNTTVEEQNKEENVLSVELNTELEGVYAFVNKTEEGKESRVDLKKKKKKTK